MGVLSLYAYSKLSSPITKSKIRKAIYILTMVFRTPPQAEGRVNITYCSRPQDNTL